MISHYLFKKTSCIIWISKMENKLLQLQKKIKERMIDDSSTDSLDLHIDDILDIQISPKQALFIKFRVCLKTKEGIINTDITFPTRHDYDPTKMLNEFVCFLSEMYGMKLSLRPCGQLFDKQGINNSTGKLCGKFAILSVENYYTDCFFD